MNYNENGSLIDSHRFHQNHNSVPGLSMEKKKGSFVAVSRSARDMNMNHNPSQSSIHTNKMMTDRQEDSYNSYVVY